MSISIGGVDTSATAGTVQYWFLQGFTLADIDTSFNGGSFQIQDKKDSCI